MTDFEGNELHEGDKVIFVNQHKNNILWRGTVKKIYSETTNLRERCSIDLDDNRTLKYVISESIYKI